jgi:hypothetical protein
MKRLRVPRITQRFNAGSWMFALGPVPAGTKEYVAEFRSVVPFGTLRIDILKNPALKRWAIFLAFGGHSDPDQSLIWRDDLRLVRFSCSGAL